MLDKYQLTILVDWRTETLRWSADDEPFTMPNLAISSPDGQKLCAVGD